MGNKAPKEIKKEDYEHYCNEFNEYLLKTKNKLDLEKAKKIIDIKIEEKAKKKLFLNLLIKKKIENLLNKMQEIFVFLYKIYDEIHRKEEDDTKKFSENIDKIKKNKKNIINAIYISKILYDDDININDVKIHDNAIYLYDVIENIEEDNNKNIDEDFKKYNNDDFYIKKEEIEKKFNEIFKKKY